ncbi:hypothetical protein [Bacillus smithii]|uniref:hypothetical protein n=1 Tax=Bacillus smithii TaxID=1479 RepID=UPI002E1F99AE|nr:hypothetical protein [Bacillus smithii]MED4928251.1 hypothetical protein [Bacillus smithii]
MDSKEIRKKFEDSIFCYAKLGGQGFVHKNDCFCGKDKSCQAFKDYQRFHERFNELNRQYDGEMNIIGIIQILKPEFENSQWWKDNIKE